MEPNAVEPLAALRWAARSVRPLFTSLRADVVGIELGKPRLWGCPLVKPTPTVAEVRSEIEHLARLLDTGQKTAFCELMELVSPSRMQLLKAADLPVYSFPILSMHIGSPPGLALAQELFEAPCEADFRPRFRIEVALRIDVRSCTGYGLDDLAFIKSSIALLEHLNNETSIFRLVGVIVDMSTVKLDSDEILQVATRLLDLALKDERRLIQVSLFVPESTTDFPYSLTAWAKLFQTVCRLECTQVSEAPPADNKIKIQFCCTGAARIISAFFSALMFSHCYTTLDIQDSSIDTGGEVMTVVFKYLGLLLSTSSHSIKRLALMQEYLHPFHVNAIRSVIDCSSHELSGILWHQPWSFENEAEVFDIVGLNSTITSRLGWVMRDSGLGEKIDVFIPGLGQCVVNRGEWSALVAALNNVPMPKHKTKTGRLCITDFDLYATTGQTEEEEEAWWKFLRLPWGDVQSLRIDAPIWVPLRFDIFQAVLETFTSLKRLHIDKLHLLARHMQIDVARIVATSLQDIHISFERDPETRHADEEATAAFLESVLPHIGRSVKTLTIHQEFEMMRFTPNILGTIVQSSPLMEKLCLRRCEVTSLEPLIDAYRRESTRITKLQLPRCSIPSREISRLVTFLTDFLDPASRVLQSLEICAPEVSCLPAFVEMLALNHSLAQVKVTCYPLWGFDLQEFQRQFESFSSELMPLPRPLPRRCIVALLSALEANRLPWNQDMVRLVAQFATAREARVVQLSRF